MKYIPMLNFTVLLLLLFFINRFALLRVFKRFEWFKTNYLTNKKLFISYIILLAGLFAIIVSSMQFKLEFILKVAIYIQLFILLSHLAILLSSIFMLIYLLLVDLLMKDVKKTETPPLNEALETTLETETKPNLKVSQETTHLKPKESTLSRKDFIKRGVFAIPTASLAISTIGLIEGNSNIHFRGLSFSFPKLPKEFDQLKIAHISDLHLGFFVRIQDLKQIIKEINKRQVDLVLITGDFVDDFNILDEAMHALKTIKSTYGTYASIGNHEYFRGVKTVIKAFKKHQIPLLINEGITLRKENAQLFIGGVDDPRRLSGKMQTFLEKSLKKVLKDAPKGEHFKLIMSHRPNLLPIASQYDVQLILSGHTHGGQFGINKRSLFESIAPKSYLWGHYQEGSTQLYTSSGAGHWFPFRIGCPAEVPIITLVQEK